MRNANAKKGNMGAVIGYARVSTDGQSVRDQIVELKAAGASRTFAEKRAFGSPDAAQGAGGTR